MNFFEDEEQADRDAAAWDKENTRKQPAQARLAPRETAQKTPPREPLPEPVCQSIERAHTLLCAVSARQPWSEVATRLEVRHRLELALLLEGAMRYVLLSRQARAKEQSNE